MGLYRLFKSLDMAGIALLKYLAVLQDGSRNDLGLRLDCLILGLRANMEECLRDLVHLLANLKASSSRRSSRRSWQRVDRADS